MQKLLYIFLIFCPITALTQSIFQAGQIKVDYIGGSAFFVLKVNVEMVATLTQNPPSAVNICWGDGLCEDISLINTSIQEDFLLLSYEGFHTYPEVGTYVISAAPCCFINFSSNIPESGEKAFPLEVKYTFYNPDSIGTNEIPRIGQPLIDVGTNAGTYSFNPMAWDSDGDSLSYELIAPEVESYQFPDEVVPFSFLEIDTMSGQVNWFNPAEGIYHLGLQIREYRQGLQLSAQTVIMQVEILSVVNSTTVQKPLAINIYPNPATDFLIIETEKKWGNDLQIRLFNTLGQLVQHKIWKGAHKLTLPVHNLPDGVYWLSIFKENKQQFEKVLICRE